MQGSVEPLSWLIGFWEGKNGTGHFPTIPSFSYDEDLEITHPMPNLPILHLNYSATRVDPVTNERVYFHFEYGFLKLRHNTNPLQVVNTNSSYTTTHYSGISVVEEGIYNKGTKTLVLESSHIATKAIREASVLLKTKRVYAYIDDQTFSSKMYMSTKFSPQLQEHLSIIYNRIE